MKYPIYSYKDNKAGFGMPVCDMSDNTAIRGFSFAINGDNSIMNFSPSDYDLYRIGEFDTESGVISSINPVLVVAGSSVYKETKK